MLHFLPEGVASHTLAAVLTAGLLFSLTACEPSQTHEVKGRVVGFGNDGRTVIVEHEEVDGFMPAMTMPFKAQSPQEVQSLEQGDAVAFTLEVRRDSSWIRDLEPLPDSAVAEHPAGEGETTSTPAAASDPLLEEGDELPAFQLVNQDGDTLRAPDYDGEALLITFIYTRCPIPDFCPRMSEHFATLQPYLKEAYGDRVQLLSISFDPEHDTPEVLAEYARDYTQDTDQWNFATGTPEEIEKITSRFGVSYEDKNAEEIIHNLSTVLVGPEGRIERIWRGNDWTPDDVMQALEEVLDEPATASAGAAR